MLAITVIKLKQYRKLQKFMARQNDPKDYVLECFEWMVGA